MLYKNVASQKLAVFAYTASTGAAKTGDAAQITAYISKDFAAAAATDDTNPTELDATNMPGWYVFTLTQAETNAEVIILAAKSSTSGVLIEQIQVLTQDAAISSRASQTSVDTIDGIVDDILVDTAVIGAAGAGLTEVVLGASQGAVTFGQVKIAADVPGEGALHITNASVVGTGVHTQGAFYGLRNVATQTSGVALYNQATGADSYGMLNNGKLVGLYNQATGADSFGMANSGTRVGQSNSGGVKDVDGVDAAGINAEVVDVLRTDALPDSYAADGAQPTIAQALLAVHQYLMERAVSGTTVTVKKPDGSTTAMTFTLDDGSNPTSITRAS